MTSIFLSHTTVDKPFVEKLAHDLRGLRIDVWFDKWEIQVGESITWKIEEDIRENEFLGIVLSTSALNSAWVKTELSSAWTKQMKLKRVIILPILYRDCEIPLFLADRKYADFRVDYQKGLIELTSALGIDSNTTISIDNWRLFAKRGHNEWKKYRQLEFEQLVTILVDRATEHNWSTWVGGSKSLFSMTLHAFIDRDKQSSISLRLDPKNLAYMACLYNEYNPNHLRASDFDIYVGNTLNECEEFVWRKMEDFCRRYGNPTEKSYHSVHRFLNQQEKTKLAIKLTKDFKSETSWYKGKKPIVQS